MWSRKNKNWTHYQKDIIAKDGYDASLLFTYMNYVSAQRLQYATTEVMDLQQYKRIQRPLQVKRIIREKRLEPFIFFYSLN